MKLDKTTTRVFIRIFCGLALLSILNVFNACSDLDPDPLEFNLPPESFGSIADLEKGVFGLYGLLRTSAVFNTFYAPAWGGDDITTFTGGNKQDFREFDQRSVSSSNARLLGNWNNLNTIINNSNIVLSRAEGLSLFDLDQDKIDELLGEVYFLRGLAFYHLARTHEKMPVSLTRLPDPNIENSTRQEVFLQIEEDLMEAESRLPAINESLATAEVRGAARANKGSARALLSRLYLDWAGFPLKDVSKYSKAAETAKRVIDEKGSHGFDLVNRFQSLWEIANRFNNESVFTIAFDQSAGIRNFKYNRVGYPGEAPFAGWDETFAEIRFFEDFPEGSRKEATFRTDIDWENLSNQQSPVFAKITGPIGDLPMEGQWHITERNDFYMRYAEVLLIYAEASARSGNTSAEAWEALNKIRRRAAGLPFSTPVTSPVPQLDKDGVEIPGLTYVDVTTGDLAELAFTERKWEFAGEFLRWNDLVRMERVEQALSNRNPQISMDAGGNLLTVPNPINGSLGLDNYFSPLPQAIVDENPNLLD
ncbi:RagB/SusD family nutrient uptake outer membrane protein [Aquimarina algiphila]|uniref:RagB/SusD family nutrient uptake outer membrane protein n=1 Tax=Aquimarina algiphila TaxID=2047982 RepID=UPI002492D1F4|nr:RagB/SusD family nutrient uptake outer membrane protein [Aquimarina algiphila]